MEKNKGHVIFVTEEKEVKANLLGMRRVQISAGSIGLIYCSGLLVDQLLPGRHSWWSFFHTWKIVLINTRTQLLPVISKGCIKGSPVSGSETTAYNIEIELGLECRITNVEVFMSYRDPITILLARVENMVFDLMDDISYDQYGQWAKKLRDLVKERLQRSSKDGSEPLLGLKVEKVYLRSSNGTISRNNRIYPQNTVSNTNQISTTIFISYAHEDEKWRRELEKQLSNLQNQGLILNWHDRQISAGTDWEDEIKEHLETAHVILLLISPDFMASKFCYSVELQQAIKRHNRGEARVIPIILRPVDWENAPFAMLQVLPTDAKPILSTHWQNFDEAFLNVAQGIRQIVASL